MSKNTLILSIIILSMSAWGDPDLIDALIYFLMK
jgi:hypothetical protein